jgi:RNA polymerase sigma-70 factor (ECF subfamily)
VIGPAGAADVTQDALLRAWRDLPSLRDPERFAPWLRRILVNRCRDVARAERRQVRQIPVDALLDAGPGVVDHTSTTERRADLDAALARLSVDQRSVLALHYFVGLPLREVALSLGIPEGTAKSRLNAGLMALRQSLGQVDG